MRMLKEHDILILKQIIEKKGICPGAGVCRNCILQAWCLDWEYYKGVNLNGSAWVIEQRLQKAKDILIYRRVNNHPKR